VALFCFRLALALGRTVDELLDSLSYAEFKQWLEFDAMEPLGERRADIRNAMLMAQQANLYRDSKKQSKPYAIRDFMPFELARERREAQAALVKPKARATVSIDTVIYLSAMAAKAGHEVKLTKD
jgi:hypothetical protein